MKTNASTSICLSLAICLTAISCGRNESNRAAANPVPHFDQTQPFEKVRSEPNELLDLRPVLGTNRPMPSLQEANEKLATLETKIQLLQWQVDNSDGKSAQIDAFSTGFSRLQTSFGTFAVSCEGAEPYLNGHKLKLRIGNPLNASFNGFKIKCEYGVKEPDNLPTDEAASDAEQMESLKRWVRASARHALSLRRMEASFPQTLVAGAWNYVELILAPTTPEELGSLRISMTTDNISLRAPPVK